MLFDDWKNTGDNEKYLDEVFKKNKHILGRFTIEIGVTAPWLRSNKGKDFSVFIEKENCIGELYPIRVNKKEITKAIKRLFDFYLKYLNEKT